MKSKILPKLTAMITHFRGCGQKRKATIQILSFTGCLLYATTLTSMRLNAQVAQPERFSSSPPLERRKGEVTPANNFSNTKHTYKIIDASGKTFGYDIYIDGRIVIHQTSVPALPGNEGFKTKTAAEKVAQLVIHKIKKR